MIKAHKIRLHPTPEQTNYFARAAGTARFVWNWALAEWNRQYEAGEKPTALNILCEALRLIGLIDQAVNGIGSDEDANLAVDAG